MSLLDYAVKQKIAKASEEREKAKNQLEASTYNDASMQLAIQGGNKESVDQATKVLEAIGNKSPEASKSVFTALQARRKDKINFSQQIKMEKYKAGTAAVTEVVKAMAERGGFSPEQLQDIQMQSSDRVYKSLGVDDIAGKIRESSEPTNQESKKQDFFSSPIPAKKSVKQREREEQMSKGNRLINDAKQQFEVIAKKHGVGRLKGLKTGLIAKAGDLVSKDSQIPEVAAYEGMVDGLAVFIGRNVYEDDRVSEADREAYKKGIGNLLNTEEEARLMFNLLDRFSKTGDTSVGSALKNIISKKGSGMKPSKALEGIGVDKNSILSREDKIAILKSRESKNG